MDINEKLKNLKSIISKMESAVVAFSGGVDSTFLLKVARDLLNERVIAGIGVSGSYPKREYFEAKRLVDSIGARNFIIETKEIDNENYSSNPENRCYYCKQELFSKLIDYAGNNGFKHVIEGSNADDESDYRPGMEAACNLGVRSPLQEANLTKSEIRILSREHGLSTWDKPSMPCLSSRFPYGTRITEENLKMIESSEQALFELGFRQFRVRYHGDIARIEVEKDEMVLLNDNEISVKIVKLLKDIGFSYITIDLEGYRMGRLNEVANLQKERV